jgi:hypothetical protein
MPLRNSLGAAARSIITAAMTIESFSFSVSQAHNN